MAQKRINIRCNSTEVISRWWFMAHTTGRYTGSSETQIETDLARLKDLPVGDTEVFCNTLDKIVRDTFTNDYWEITLPNRLDTSSAKSPPLIAYWAALNLLDAEVLFSSSKVNSLLDPLINPVKDMERHHLFPKAYLKDIGVKGRAQVNAIANMAFVDWTENLAISDSPPAEYWPVMTSSMSPQAIERHAYWHALPLGWEQLSYDEFCEKRRRLISCVIRDGYKRLVDGKSEEVFKPVPTLELAAQDESNTLEFKERARWSHNTDKKGKSEQIIVKTIAGFMNSEGGTLLIGVSDDHKIVGLEEDYATLSKANRDGYELFLNRLVGDKLTGPSPTLCKISFERSGEKDVCRVDVAAAAKPVFACPWQSKEPTDFWVRQGNSTNQLHGTELTEYVDEHWG